MHHIIEWMPLAASALNLTGAALTFAAGIHRNRTDRKTSVREQDDHGHDANPGQGNPK
ncbi:hypothetical protein ACIBQX_49140 [Nonomuraea sp. NPDC049714]|uniref:hypothetical protein n=1 Tax=Nonomuraea sp. NPDC049714 TaxID=3364357 RepID=UPI0037AD15F1